MVQVRARGRGRLTSVQRGAATEGSLRRAKVLTSRVRPWAAAGEREEWVHADGRPLSLAERAGMRARVVAAGVSRGAVSVGRQVVVGGGWVAGKAGTGKALVESGGDEDLEQQMQMGSRSAARGSLLRALSARDRRSRVAGAAIAGVSTVGSALTGGGDVDATYLAASAAERGSWHVAGVAGKAGAKVGAKAAGVGGRLTGRVAKRGLRTAGKGARWVARRSPAAARTAWRGARDTARVAAETSRRVTRAVATRAAVVVKTLMVSAASSTPGLVIGVLAVVLVMLLVSLLPPWLMGVGESQPDVAVCGGGGEYNLGPVKPHVEAVTTFLGKKYAVSTIGGYRPGNTYDVEGHPAGLAVDMMFPVNAEGYRRGQAAADYIQAHAGELGVRYLIWQQRIWSVARQGEGWRGMPDRGSVSANHLDHIHVSFNPEPGSGDVAALLAEACGPDAEGDAAAGGVAPAAVGAGGWVRPSASSRVSSPFGMRVHPVTGVRKLHTGTDWSAGCGAPVRAAGPGVVSGVKGSPAYGTLITIDHGGGIQTRYAHSYRRDVTARVGRKVRAGELIAKVGSAGYSTGCHLHFEVKRDGGFVDPLEFLKGRGV